MSENVEIIPDNEEQEIEVSEENFTFIYGDMLKSVYDKNDNGIVDKATADANGNVINTTYATNVNLGALSNRVISLENAGFITKDVNNLTNYYNKNTIDGKTQQIDNTTSNIIDKINNPTYTTTEGKAITITNARVGNMKFEFYGDTSQSGTPTPTNPVPVQSVTGANTINIVGKNLFDKNHANIINNCVTGSGQTLDNVEGCKTLYISCKPNTTYTVSKIASTRFIVVTTNTTPAIGVSTSVRTIDLTGTHITITTGANANYICVFYYYSASDTIPEQQILDSIMIEQSSTATTYEAYKNQPFDLNLGKNLFDKILASTGKGVSTGDGTLYTSADNFATDFISVSQGNYVVSGFSTASNRVYGATYNSNKVYIGAIATNVGTKTFSIGSGISYIRLTGFTSEINTYQLEKGLTITSYAPYFKPIELCKIGDYQDYLYNNGGKWFKHTEVGKVILNGSESDWAAFNVNYEYQLPFETKASFDTEGVFITGLYSSHFKNTAQPSADMSNYAFTFFASAGYRWFRFRYNEITSLADFKTWLASNNVTIYYPLKASQEEEITDLTALTYLNNIKYGAESYYGTTNIMITSTDIQPTMKVQTIDKIV